VPGPESSVRPGVQSPSGVPSPPARVIVSRTLDGDVGQRQVYVDLDGERLGHLLVGERFSKEITTGRHLLKLNNTLVWKTIEFEAAEGEVVEYRFANKAGRFALPFLAVMGVAPLYLTVERVTAGNQR
jgi:hypothetical protein